MAGMSDEELLLARVPKDGASVGNVSLRRALRWGVDRYFNVRDLLVQRGVLKLGLGRGGSVRLAVDIPEERPSSKAAQLSSPRAENPRPVDALIIGNQAYGHGPLANPRKDASDFAKLMKSLGHRAELHLDLKRREMLEVLTATARKLSVDRGFLFYYAGHGCEFEEDNWLFPIDCDSSNEDELVAQSIPLRRTFKKFKSRFRITILDACRSHPFRGLGRGDEGGLREFFPPEDTPEGDFICYATSPRTIARDGKPGMNGVFTAALLKHFKEATGISIGDIMIRVRREVMAATKNRQVPWEHTSLTANWYPNPGR